MRNQLPLPIFTTITAVVNVDRDSVVIIAPVFAGRRNTYNTFRIQRLSGATTLIGCELPLRMSRRIAARAPHLDGQPVPPAPNHRRTS